MPGLAHTTPEPRPRRPVAIRTSESRFATQLRRQVRGQARRLWRDAQITSAHRAVREQHLDDALDVSGWNRGRRRIAPDKLGGYALLADANLDVFFASNHMGCGDDHAVG